MAAKFLTAASLVIMTAQAAQGGEWQYCLAPSSGNHTVFMSQTFPVRGDVGDADVAFGAMLDKGRLPHDSVQCPRADDANVIATMQEYAIKHNRQNGIAIIRLPLEK